MRRVLPATLVLLGGSAPVAQAAASEPAPAGPVAGPEAPREPGPEGLDEEPPASEGREPDPASPEAEAAPGPGEGEPEPNAEGPAAGGDVGASVSLGAAGGRAEGRARGRKRPKPSKRTDRPWIRRWAPENGMWELGPYIGVLFPARDVELFEADLDLPDQGFRRLDIAALEVGGRAGYYPMRWFGLEVEGGYAPTETRFLDQRVHGWMVRGHLVGQLGLWSVTPFVLVGGGVLSVSSPRAAVGDDVDQAFHMGLGAKIYINRWIQARVDFRDVLSPARGINGGPTNNLELLFGFAVTFGRDRDEPKKVPPPRPKPEPEAVAPKDTDGDGFLDPQDACPDVPGIEPDGCPPPDTDKDGFVDPEDACPEEPGIAPDGCPDRDPDHDAILNPDDKCPNEPENRNGFEDEDGCPDQLPEEVTRFTGTIEGVYFDVNKASLRPQSRKVLDEAVAVLKKYDRVRVEISGHTDSTGRREHNMELSRERAESVKNYLVEQGVDASRIQTRGAGPDEPIDSNATKQGRSRNRRIEFRILD